MTSTLKLPARHPALIAPAAKTQPTRKARQRARKALVILGGSFAAVLGFGWAGLHVQPAPFPSVAQPSATPTMIALPTNLPAPVERFYRQTYGEQVPVIRSAVISGRGSIRLFNITFPARFRFTHEAERNFRSYIEVTLFGFPLMKVNEYFVNGQTRMETPVGVQENSPKLNQGGNVRLWAEWATWLPAMLLTDEQVHWKPIDDATALLVVPFKQEQEHFVVRFDPASGTMQYIEAMRYQSATSPAKSLWISGVWFGDTPWAEWNIEDVVYNVPVDTSLAAKGP